MKTLVGFNGFSFLVTRNVRPKEVPDWKWNLKGKGAFRAPQVQSAQLSLQVHTEVNGDLGNPYLINNSVLSEPGVHASWTLHG